MSSEIQPAKVDENKLNQFIGQMLGDLGGQIAWPWCV